MYINLDGVYEHLRIRIVLWVMNRLHELFLYTYRIQPMTIP